MKEYLSPARLPGESFEDYRERRKRVNWATRQVTKFVNGRPSSITKDGVTFKVTYTKGGPIVHRHTATKAITPEGGATPTIHRPAEQPEARAPESTDLDDVVGGDVGEG